MIYYGESTRENGVYSVSVEMTFNSEESGFFGTTGNKTLDLLLGSFCRYGQIELNVEVEETNEYTADTVAVLMGNCTRAALEDIDDEMVASCEMPFGESLAKSVVDLSEDALTAFVFDCELADDKKYISDFLKTYAYAMGKTLHVYVFGNGGDRHKAEAVFRSLGKCFFECLK
ncbi:MAG: hypothetical protein IJN75_03675 [Clostridia bacterium]|nr:hypothetical protein [Clostridia bacterium]